MLEYATSQSPIWRLLPWPSWPADCWACTSMQKTTITCLPTKTWRMWNPDAHHLDDHLLNGDQDIESSAMPVSYPSSIAAPLILVFLVLAALTAPRTTDLRTERPPLRPPRLRRRLLCFRLPSVILSQSETRCVMTDLPRCRESGFWRLYGIRFPRALLWQRAVCIFCPPYHCRPLRRPSISRWRTLFARPW